MYTNRVFGTAKCVLFIEVSSFQGIPIQRLDPTVCSVLSLGVMIRSVLISRRF